MNSELLKPRFDSKNYQYPSEVLFWMLAILFCSVGVITQTPNYPSFLIDGDLGHFLLGGRLFSVAGELPYIDYLHVYGPLAFVPNGIAQVLFDNKLIGEVILLVSGFSLAYFLLFYLTYKTTRSRIIPFFIVFVALIFMPRFYKYYVVLVPYATLLACYSYICSPSIKKATVLGAVVGVSFLYRHDLGVYAALPVLTTWFITCRNNKHYSFEHFFSGLLCATTIVAIWLTVLLLNNGLMDYIHIILSSGQEASGLSLPHPLFNWYNPRLTYLYFTFTALIVLLLVTLIFNWKKIPNETRSFVIVVLVASVMFFSQSHHRADLAHLKQGIPTTFVILPLLWSIVKDNDNYTKKLTILLPAVTAITLILISVCITTPVTRIKKILNLNRQLENYHALNLPSDSMIELAVKHHFKYGIVVSQLTTIIKSCSKVDERIAVYPYSPQIVYFSGRLPVDPLFVLGPGALSAEKYQSRLVESLSKKESVSLVIWDENFAFDKKQERNPVNTHKKVHNYVAQNFENLGKFADYSIYFRSTDIEKMKMCRAALDAASISYASSR